MSIGSNNFDYCALTSSPATATILNLINSHFGLRENLVFECIFGVIINENDFAYGENIYNEIWIENENSGYKCDYDVPAPILRLPTSFNSNVSGLKCLKILF